MWVRRLLITVCSVSATLFGIAACGPAAQSPDSAAVSAPETEIGMATVTEIVTNEGQNSEEENVLDETPMSDEEVAAAPPGQSTLGAAGEGTGSAPGAAGGGSPTEPQGSGERPPPVEMLVYADSVYGFSVGYPADYLFRTEPAEKLAPLDPKPVASFVMINPTLAASDIAEIEPADLEIRIHAAEGAASLQDWLASHGFLAAGNLPAKPFQAANVTGLEVCASTMIAPGCSYFVLGDSWVYQMVPASVEGEAIMHRFALVR